MQVARRLFQLGQAQATGLLRAVRNDGSTAQLAVELSRGWVYGVDVSPAYSLGGDAALSTARGEDRLRVFLKVTADGGPYQVTSFDALDESKRPAGPKRGACTPFHPAQSVRNYLDTLTRDAAAWRFRAGGGRVTLSAAPHASCLGQDERPLVAFLSRPRTIAEIEAANLCPAERAWRLCAFLEAAGVLTVSWDEGTSPFAVLALPESASSEDVRRAFRRLALELHPDCHPSASPAELAELERRFAEVSAAYRRLV